MRALIVILLITVCAVLIFLFPHRMMEPGELSSVHQTTGNDCFACHRPFGGLPNERCVACHTVADIGRDTLPGTEPTLFHDALGNMACVECHSEHMGRSADITPMAFQHSFLTAPLSTDCITCHAPPTDPLHAKLPATCTACHDTQGWKPARDFDHDLLTVEDRNDCASCHSEPTDAMHARTIANCTQCHGTSGWKPAHFDHAVLTVTEKNACASCHTSPADAFHQGTKDNCASCHGTNAWSPSTFDHDRYFLLDGDHNAKCVTCHKTNDYTTYTCYGCHEHTLSNIMGEHREEGITNIADCVRCHRSGDEHEAKDRRKGERSGKKHDKEDDD